MFLLPFIGTPLKRVNSDYFLFLAGETNLFLLRFFPDELFAKHLR